MNRKRKWVSNHLKNSLNIKEKKFQENNSKKMMMKKMKVKRLVAMMM